MVKPRLINGDCVEEMRKLPEASIDAVVCDPPYHLRFMSKAWDHAPTPRESQETHERWAVEAFRVLKPGGHLLAFGGTRTSHRLACAVEDAGFEIRDSVIWMYGSGFPKSMDVSKAIDKAARGVPQGGADPTSENHGRFKTSKTEGRPGTQGQQFGAGPGQFMKPGDIDPATGRRVVGRRTDGRYKHGFSEKAKKAMGGVVASESDTGFSGDMGLITEPATPEAEQWSGWGTALKPAHEPIVVARKPLVGTVVGNVLEHGTGAINVDGCRVEGEPRATGTVNPHAESGVHDIYGSDARTDRQQTYDANLPTGRWPANVVLSHAEDCVPVGTKRVKAITGTVGKGAYGTGTTYGEGKGNSGRGSNAGKGDPDGTEAVEAWECVEGCPVAALDRQTGDVAGAHSQNRLGRSNAGGYQGGITEPRLGFVESYNDRGGASRFFYVAKASRGERNAGLDGFEERMAYTHNIEGRDATKPTNALGGGERARVERGEPGIKPARNTHPTVKPISLMRWLCRLVTPPGGTVLDPFMGSGTTGIAALIEGFEFVGIEKDTEQGYMDIAEARIEHWRKMPNQMARRLTSTAKVTPKRGKKPRAGQLSMEG